MQWIDLCPTSPVKMPCGLDCLCYYVGMTNQYTEAERLELIEEVLLAVESNSIRGACAEVGVPVGTFRSWMDGATADLIARYARARTLYPDKLISEALELADQEIPLDEHGKTDSGLVQQRKSQIELRKWIASKLGHRRYGDRLTVAGDDTAPIVIHKIERKIIDTMAVDVSQEEIDDER